MAVVTIKLAPVEMMGSFYFSNQSANALQAREQLAQYQSCTPFVVMQEGVDAAEECFDLTNNPYRQDQREAVYGRGRSVSVGDVIDVDGISYLCSSRGWNII